VRAAENISAAENLGKLAVSSNLDLEGACRQSPRLVRDPTRRNAEI